jgi:CRISPR-associated protein Csm1
LCVFDFSGIQKFIYNINNKNALKNLRSRSLYLELLGEYFSDMILSRLSLSRANVFQIGGGHGYILLPNTELSIKVIEEQETSYNNFLLKHFDYNLFMAVSYKEASVNELTDDYDLLLTDIFDKLSLKKRTKYDSEIIRKLNLRENIETERECSFCGKTDKLVKIDDDMHLCEMCNSFSLSSSLLEEERKYYVIRKNMIKNETSLIFPYFSDNSFLYFYTKDEFEKVLAKENDVLFSYTKNEYVINKFGSKTFYVADYAATHNDKMLTIEEIVEKDYGEVGVGIKRIAVMKLDVDDLGITMKNGLDKKMHTISRMAAFSDNLSMYFKYYINIILKEKELNCSVIYSGGDDVFVVGSLMDLLNLATTLRDSFEKYTIRKLHFSAGIGLFNVKYPFYRIAKEMGKLENTAKEKSERKNSICIFESKKEKVLDWKSLDGLMHDELELIRLSIEKNIITNTMLYSSIYKALLSKDENKTKYKIAYLFGRTKEKLLEDKETQDLHSNLFRKIMDSIGKKDLELTKLIVAIQIYIYSNRRREEQHD